MKTWIFQSNPDVFKIDEYIKQEYMVWTIRQEHFAEIMEVADIVYIWKSKGSGADAEIVAKGELVSGVGDYHDELGAKLYTSEIALQESQKFKKIQIRIISRGSIWKRDLLKDETLKELKIIRFAQNTNYLIEEEAERKLNILWSKNYNLFNSV